MSWLHLDWIPDALLCITITAKASLQAFIKARGDNAKQSDSSEAFCGSPHHGESAAKVVHMELLNV